jgi:guanylate kinase
LTEGKGKIIAVSAPSGTGKTTIIKELLKSNPDLVFSVSATTRKRRNSEIDGVDYFFIAEDEFIRKIDNNEFVEWEKFYDYYYGTYKKTIEENVNKGKNVIVEIDVNGALALKEIYPDAVLIFILPPTLDELINRLKNRKTESDADLHKRIKRVKMELSHKDNFDYFIKNEILEKAISDIKSLIKKIIQEN